MAGKYMAYVGSYSYNGQAKGITVYDVDVENGYFKYRCEVEVDNSSYLAVSHDGKTLYSIADEGVVSFRILPNGGHPGERQPCQAEQRIHPRHERLPSGHRRGG